MPDDVIRAFLTAALRELRWTAELVECEADLVSSRHRIRVQVAGGPGKVRYLPTVLVERARMGDAFARYLLRAELWRTIQALHGRAAGRHNRAA